MISLLATSKLSSIDNSIRVRVRVRVRLYNILTLAHLAQHHESFWRVVILRFRNEAVSSSVSR